MVKCVKKMLIRNFKIAAWLNAIFFIALWNFGSDAREMKWSFDNDVFESSKSLKPAGLFPSTFNVALEAEIFANATCGQDGPETYCKSSERVRCAICDAKSPDPGKRHHISNVLNPDPGKWWQSPTLARGDRFEYIEITLDLKQIYQIENIIIKAAISPRPASWVLKRSVDGEKFQAWQYYARSDEECWTKYSIPPIAKTVYLKDEEVVCTSIYSRQKPVENGEIHTHLMHGRSGAYNHSTSYLEFSQARYLRLSLQGLQKCGDGVEDKLRAFYSIKEISVGGRCPCFGHASRCRYSPRHERQICECERHTCGENCEKCCPMYNQIQWKPGTSSEEFQCEKCNCHNHASSCRYDHNIASQRHSIDTSGNFKGGGVCINCMDHTTGINCEKCQDGYYRPKGVSADAPKPCIPCDHCNLRGSTGICTPDGTYPRKVAGACDCKSGYSGYKCDQCAAGFRHYPECMPCPCDSRGILPSHDCEGDCLCKKNVNGEFCDRCRLGYFALKHENQDGCLKCDCFGVTEDCQFARLKFESISILDGWRVTDINASRSIMPTLNPDTHWLTIASFEVEYDNPFWLAPKLYLGNRLSSYGSNLTFRVSWTVLRGDTSGKPTAEPDVIIVGENGISIACGEEQYAGQEAHISVKLVEQHWYYLQSKAKYGHTQSNRDVYRSEPVTRVQMLRVLANVKHLMIRAKYHSEQVEGSFFSAMLPIGERTIYDGFESIVEHCNCPDGYSGLSCESCSWGYAKVILNDSSNYNHHLCAKCDCNNHAESCDLFLGECKFCEHHTTGVKCERCAPGYYGNSMKGTPTDCRPCACPLMEPSNQFSTSCQLDGNFNDSYVCTQCLVGYTGDHCESCDIGYYGNPLKIGGTCEPCRCNGGTCNPETGICLECRENTQGQKCDECKENYYGDPLKKNCTECECNMIGSLSPACDIFTGQCQCKANFAGHQCLQCKVGYWGMATETGCFPCNCHTVGSLNTFCDAATGQCTCRPGVTGKKCDRCLLGYYGFTRNGCHTCDGCEKAGHVCDQDTGRCVCPQLTFGEHCDRCRPDSYGLVPGIGCNPCACASGSLKSQCDTYGQCSCRLGFVGLRCNQCAPGFYGYPRCKPCGCHEAGTISCLNGSCHCDRDGQCPCKRNVIGRQCDKCKEGTFGLNRDNSNGCTECFCFGRSTSCYQASLSWGQRWLPHTRVLRINELSDYILITHFGYSVTLPISDGGVSIINGLSTIPGDVGDVLLPTNFSYRYPLYWKLPVTFLGDKTISYGGVLKFKTKTNGGKRLQIEIHKPLVQIQGNNEIILEYYQTSPSANDVYEIRLHESLWNIHNKPNYTVTREIFMVALQNLQYILVKASELSGFDEVILLEASLDIAILVPTHSLPVALGVEICVCPAEYNNTSCQDPSIGYYRWFTHNAMPTTRIIDLVGKARSCQCSGRSELCDIETGYCQHCKHNTAGKHCNVCANGYYGLPDQNRCKPCTCPHVDKNFSNSCIMKTNNKVICHCKLGYMGPRCERCSYGFYGYPQSPNGVCTPCNCHPAGSASDECDEESGQCNCKFGSTGRDCSQCADLKNVFINGTCISCDNNCTGILLNDINIMAAHSKTQTVHIANGYVPHPWLSLELINETSIKFTYKMEQLNQLELRFRNLPFSNFNIFIKRFEDAFENATRLVRQTSNMKVETEVHKKKILNSLLDVEELRKLLKNITVQVIRYRNGMKNVKTDKSLEDAFETLKHLKSVNFSEEKRKFQGIINETIDYAEWCGLQLNLIQPLERIEWKIIQYTDKFDQLNFYIQNTIEILFTYDILFSQVNSTYNGIKYNKENIDIVNADIRGTIDEGFDLHDRVDRLIIDNSRNFKKLNDIKSELNYCYKKLHERIGISHRLNSEYGEKYVKNANSHAIVLSRFVDDYVALFDQTRNEASNSLEASQTYKHIADKLTNAIFLARKARKSALESQYKMNSRDSQLKSYLANMTKLSEKTSTQLVYSMNLSIPLDLLQKKWYKHRHAVLDLKNSLNVTGITDNLINIRLRELKSSYERRSSRLSVIRLDNEQLVNSISDSEKLINNYKQGITSGLRPGLHELKREGDSKISLASEKSTEAQSNIKRADAKLISLSYAAEKRQIEFGRWNETFAEKLSELRVKISEARNTADGIRISLKSSEGKKCIRSYRSNLVQPSSMTLIEIMFTMTQHQTEGTLFYLASSINDDFVALEMIESKIRFLWNVGGGTGIVTHPEVLKTSDTQIDNYGYRIKAERTKHSGKLTIEKDVSYPGKILSVSNSTNSEFGLFGVATEDRIWVGGTPPNQKRPVELIAPIGFPGCIHQVVFDDRPIGIWNFFTTTNDKSCNACVEGAKKAKEDIAYSFNGEGYAVRNRVSSGPHNKYTFGVSISFKTFDENALLFLALNPTNSQHLMIFLRDGYLVMHIGYGEKVTMEMTSKYKYNKGKWTQVDAFRQYQLKKNIEKCSFTVNGENDKRIGVPNPQPKKENIPDLAQAIYYIGGVPPSFHSRKLILPSTISFLGCISNINVQEGYDPMAEQYYGVEPECNNKPIRIVGFYGDGFLEHQSFTIKKISSTLSFSFRSTQQEAMLLLSTFVGPNGNNQKFEINEEENQNIYYSAAIVYGKICIHLNAGQGELILESNDTFNDGKYHTISIIKSRKKIELNVDDAYQASGKLFTSAAIRGPEFGGLYFGGLPVAFNNTKMIGSIVPLYGAIKNVVLNENILRFDEALTFNRAFIGRSGPNVEKDISINTNFTSLSGHISSQLKSCQKVLYYSLEPGALKFGDKSHSHSQLYLNFKNFWEEQFTIEFDFRTYYPNGLLFITPGIRRKQYLMVVIRDGRLLLLIKNKLKKEIYFETPLNDGNWHKIVINHDGRNIVMIIDSQTPRMIKVPKKIGLESMMYIGGMPESGTPFPDQIVSKLETLKGCIRSLRVNGNIYDMVGSTSRAVSVGQCFSEVESGAYFQDDAYAVLKRVFELGTVLELELEFRTSEISGILLLLTASDSDLSLSLELNNGNIIMSGDLGNRRILYVKQQFLSLYTMCDNQWHKIRIILNNEDFTLKVDDHEKKYSLQAEANNLFMTTIASFSLFIGGLPASSPIGTLETREYFNGCMKNVIINGERRDWTDMAELHNIHLSSCPI